jgi:hypothetical protein
MNIVGRKGYKMKGYFEGCVGTIEICTCKGFEYLYTIRFRDGSGVTVSKEEIVFVEDK